MEKFIETQASSVEVAIDKALLELGVDKDKVEIEVLQKGNLFAKAKVRVTIKDTIKDKLEVFFNKTLEYMGLSSRATVEQEGNTLYVNIKGDDSGVAIGHRGEALDAFQYLALTFLNEQKCEFKKVVVDCENYREKRKETLTALAQRLAQKSVRLARKIALEPMNPFERRIIHSALADSELASTQSAGEEPNRYIVIIPKGVELKDDRPIKNGERTTHNKKERDGRPNNKNNKPRNRRPQEDVEVEDGRVYRGYFLGNEDFVKPQAQAGPPKFKSFGGNKRF